MNGKVVVTAAGVISPLAASLENFAYALYARKTAVAPSPRFPALAAADLGEFDPKTWLGNKGVRVLDRSARLLAVATQMSPWGARLLQPAEEDWGPDVAWRPAASSCWSCPIASIPLRRSVHPGFHSSLVRLT